MPRPGWPHKPTTRSAASSRRTSSTTQVTAPRSSDRSTRCGPTLGGATATSRLPPPEDGARALHEVAGVERGQLGGLAGGEAESCEPAPAAVVHVGREGLHPLVTG